MTRAIYNSGNRDANEADIRNVLDARNIRYTQFKPGDGADLLIWINPMEIWEIKNPDQPPSKRALTRCEQETLEYCKQAGIPYVVIDTVEAAADRLNKYFGAL